MVSTKTEGRLRHLWHAPWLWMALIVALFCVPLFAGLGQPDFDNDEAIYSFSVDVMLKAGDWLTPKSIPSETLAFLEKPPLKFWVVGLPIRWGLLPANEFGMRFWDAVMGSVAFLYIFAIGRRLAGPLCGFTAVLLLFSHGPLVLEHGLRTNNMEASVFLAYAAGMYHFLAWRSSGPDSRGHIFAIAVYFVLGFMTKFVAALFLPVILGIAVLLTAEDRVRLRRHWLTVVFAGLVAAALIAPWFIYEYATRGHELFDTMFGAHVVRRFTASLDPTHLRPWHFYFTEMWRQLQTSGAGVLVGLGAALVLVRALRRRWLEGALIVLWFAVPLGLISTGTSKLYHYAYPFLPPVALAGGYAAASIVDWIWQVLGRPVTACVAARGRALPRVLLSAPVRATLTVLGVAGLALAVATGLLQRVRLGIGDTLLLRNSSVMRPLVGGALAILAGGPAILIRAMVPVAVWLSVMPFPAYNATLTLTRRVDHPLQDTRACLASIVDRLVAEGQPPPGVWVEGHSFSHRYTYYLYGLGPWHQRDIASDATVAMHLFAANAFRPVMLAGDRYGEFMKNFALDTPGILARAAARAELSPEALLDEFHRTDIGVITLESATLLLPGPYGACTPERRATASR